MYKKLVSPSLTELFVEEIKRLVLSGQLAVGEKLPPERQLAEKMDVSVAVVHAGITRLAALGLLRVEPRKGVFVADYLRDGNLATMMEIIEYRHQALGPEIIEPICMLRREVEREAARLACGNRTDEQLESMESLLDEMRAKPAALSELGFRFYHELTFASGNPFMSMLCVTFQPAYEVFLKLEAAEEGTGDRIVERLVGIYEAIRDRDGDAAVRAIDVAIDAWMDEFKGTDE